MTALARSRRVAWALFVLVAALGGRAQAAGSSELWPELSAYIGLTPQTRLYLDASYARGRESTERSLDVSGFVDVSIEPLLRERLRTEDWQRSRFLWTRVGYTRVFKSSEGATSVAEDRVSAALYAKAEMPAGLLLEGRVRMDMRWIGGSFSTRPRVRLEASREFTLQEHSVVPYLQIEGFWDGRYDGLSRRLYQLGTELTLDPHFRIELYLARQNDRLPSQESLNALGLVAKWYY